MCLSVCPFLDDACHGLNVRHVTLRENGVVGQGLTLLRRRPEVRDALAHLFFLFRTSTFLRCTAAGTPAGAGCLRAGLPCVAHLAVLTVDSTNASVMRCTSVRRTLRAHLISCGDALLSCGPMHRRPIWCTQLGHASNPGRPDRVQSLHGLSAAPCVCFLRLAFMRCILCILCG